MKALNLFSQKYNPRSQIKPVYKHLMLKITLLLSLLLVSTAYADATFGSYAGPQWLNPGYQFTVDVTLTEPHKYVGLTYAVNSVPYPCVECTGGPGTWVCTINSDYDNSSVNWRIAAYPNSRCSGTSVQGPIGNFTTGPTVIGLTSFVAENSKTTFISSGFILIIASSAMFILLVLGVKYKRGKHVL